MQLTTRKIFFGLILLISSTSFAESATSRLETFKCNYNQIQIRVPKLSALENTFLLQDSFHKYEEEYDLKCVSTGQRFILLSEQNDYLYLDVKSLERAKASQNPYPATKQFLMESAD